MSVMKLGRCHDRPIFVNHAPEKGGFHIDMNHDNHDSMVGMVHDFLLSIADAIWLLEWEHKQRDSHWPT